MRIALLAILFISVSLFAQNECSDGACMVIGKYENAKCNTMTIGKQVFYQSGECDDINFTPSQQIKEKKFIIWQNYHDYNLESSQIKLLNAMLEITGTGEIVEIKSFVDSRSLDMFYLDAVDGSKQFEVPFKKGYHNVILTPSMTGLQGFAMKPESPAERHEDKFNLFFISELYLALFKHELGHQCGLVHVMDSTQISITSNNVMSYSCNQYPWYNEDQKKIVEHFIIYE